VVAESGNSPQSVNGGWPVGLERKKERRKGKGKKERAV
jgi:hypothetical protein